MKGRTHRSRCDGIGSNVEPPPFRSRATSQPHDRCLCRVVVAVQPGADLDIDGIEVDNLAAASRFHVGQCGFHRPPGRPHCRTEGFLQHRVGFFFQKDIGCWRKGVVNQYVQTTELINGQLHGSFDIGLAAHVGLDEHRLGTQRFEFGDYGLATGDIQLGDHHSSALFGKVQRDTAAYSATCTGNQRDLFV
ncbi:hypothetical protein D3C86_1559220 [compost metagenome]